jgi:hypothetical protein
MQRYRERQLEPPGEEEEEDEEEEEQTQEDAGDQETMVTNDQDDANKSGQSVISLRLQFGPPHFCCEACRDSYQYAHVAEIMNEELEGRRYPGASQQNMPTISPFYGVNPSISQCCVGDILSEKK